MYISMGIELTSVLVYDNTNFPPLRKRNLIPSAAYMHALGSCPTSKRGNNMSATCIEGFRGSNLYLLKPDLAHPY